MSLHRSPVVPLQAAAQSSRSASSRSGSGRNREVRPLSRTSASPPGLVNDLPFGNVPLDIDRELAVHRAPLADGVVVFETEAEHIHPVVAGRADRVGAMLLELLPQRARIAYGLFIKRRHVRRRRRAAARREYSGARTSRESPARCASDSSKRSERSRGSGCRRAGRSSARRGGTRAR